MILLLTVLRGLRSRALLSSGSVLLTALAIGSALLGPIFSVAVTNSFLVSRLDEAPNPSTGLTWRFTPAAALGGLHDAAEERAASAADAAAPDLFAPAQTTLQTQRLDTYAGNVMLMAHTDTCAHLEIEGSCPTEPGEVMVLAGDLTFTGLAIGDTVDLEDLGGVTIVGSYRAPDAEEADFWFDPQRFASIPPHETRSGTTPYLPAPWVTVPEAFDQLPQQLWTVLVDRRFDVPPDLTLDDIDEVTAAAAALDDSTAGVDGGTLEGESINDVAAVATEARGQQRTARNSIAPAVLSLVLVALALLLRLLMAAADLRLPELALASLRGLSRRRMWQLGLSEPLTLLLLATPVGVVVGIVMSLALLRVWLVPGLPLPLPWQAWLTAGGVVVATIGVALLAVGMVLRVSLSEQLTGVRRPRRTGRVGVVAQLALVATALAVLASKLSAGAPGDPDVTDLVLPVLLAVVAGLGASRVTAAGATWWTRRRGRTKSLPAFVAARAVSRRQEGTLVILPVTAAIAICVFGAGVYGSAAEWRASVAATIAPAPVLWTSPQPLNPTVDLTHEIDPDGQYLMAITTIVTQGPSFTIADTSRLSRVVSWQKQWTPGVSTDEIADRLGLKAQVPTLRGTVVGATLDRRTDPGEQPMTMQLRLNSPDGDVHSLFLGPFAQGVGAAEAEAPYCAKGCELEAITLGGPAAVPITMAGTVRVSAITADGKPVQGSIDGAGWSKAPGSSAGDGVAGVSTEGSGGDASLEITLDSADRAVVAQLSAGALPSALPVVKGVDAPLTQAAGAASADATSFAVDPVVEARSVPLLGPVGLLIDYRTLTTDRSVFVQDAPVYVLARSDTPAAMREALQDRGATVSTTLTAEQRTLDQSAYALALRLYAVVAVLVLLMAMAGLFVSTAVQLPARRRDAASLRVVGVPRRSVMSAVLRELVFVLGGTAVAGLAAGSLAQYVVLRTVTLGYVTDLATPALVAAIDPTRLVVLAVMAALLFGSIALVSAALTVRGARGATLRENAR